MRYKWFSSNCISRVKSRHQKVIGEEGRNVRSQGMITGSGIIQQRENPAHRSCDE